MKKQEWNDGLDHLNPDLVEKYVQKKESLRKKQEAKKNQVTRIWVKWGAMAACLALIACIIPIAKLVFTGSNSPAPYTERYTSDDRSIEGKITYFTCDWPYYDSIQSLCDAATNIYEGKVSNVFFKIIDMRSGTAVDEKVTEDKTYLRLYTVYEIDVTDSYKNAKASKKYVCVCTGLEGYKEAEQRNLMKSAEIYNDDIGIGVLREFEPLEVGASYLFLTVDLGGTYDYIVNVDQFAYIKNGNKNTEGFEYSEVKSFITNQVRNDVE